jgi:hypothetical protein
MGSGHFDRLALQTILPHLKQEFTRQMLTPTVKPVTTRGENFVA